MNSIFYIDVDLVYFCIVFGAMLVIALIMNWQSKYFYTLHVFVRKFSMIDLQSPASPLELATYIKGIFLLPPELARKSLRNLKANLHLDFIFMPLAYGSIFLFCMQISMKLTWAGHSIFALLAWLQIIPWICDIAENIYLLKKLRPNVQPSTPAIHRRYQVIEICKWGISLSAIVCCISITGYFWLTGQYQYNSVQFAVLLLAEIALVFIAKKIADKVSPVNLDDYKTVGN